jgi:hypothetical protein
VNLAAAASAPDGTAPLGVHGAELVISLAATILLITLVIWLIRHLTRR